ncbi:MerR family transcriptional regulator [Paenibacillus physcomitrellae]|uniref:MerR family transcriptional regulator n=1 Tax=Paenibacillus physcomitrellae TaxID=1619311 RepID=A0ABQ1GRR1_9BACL|nr:MerR family transcriptional regulator [Paenibacillus physcomitrellae]GGA49099.1 MerR family transcriptional regulator [Paenibacillus physcomitrellae]
MYGFDHNRSYTIAEIAEQTGLSPDTLRYYEKIGLILPPERGYSGQREYSPADLGKIVFVTHLRNTRMPLKKIQEYIKAYNVQNEEKCYALLDEHRQVVESEIEEWKATLDLLKYKLEHFQEVKDGKLSKGADQHEHK